MKLFKKLLCLALSLIMACGFAATAFSEDGTLYTVTCTDEFEKGHGTVSANVSSAAEGDTVYLTVTPDEGYTVYELRKESVSGWIHYFDKELPVDPETGRYYFTMPGNDVTVYYTFAAAHTAVLDFGKNHAALAARFEGAEGYTVNGPAISFAAAGDNRDEVKEFIRAKISKVIDELTHYEYFYDGTERMDSYVLGLKPMEKYAGPAELRAEVNAYDAPYTDGTVWYMLWDKPAQDVSVYVEPPVCGLEIRKINDYAAGGGNASPTSDHAPVIRVSGSAELFRSPYHANTDGFWCDNAEGDWTYRTPYNGFYEGAVEAGSTYYATMEIQPAFGYYLKSVQAENGEVTAFDGYNLTIAVKGDHDWDEGTPVKDATCLDDAELYQVCRNCGVDRTVPLAGTALGHLPGEAVKENEKAASCTKDGSYDSVIYCTREGCGVQVSRNTVTVKAKGHTWGSPKWNWAKDSGSAVAVFKCGVCKEEAKKTASVKKETVKEPTAEAEGEIKYTASVKFEGKTYKDVKTAAVPPTGEKPPEGNLCKWDGIDHGSSFGGRLTAFFHSILYLFAHLFGAK